MSQTASDVHRMDDLLAELERLRKREQELRQRSADLLYDLRRVESERDRLFALSIDMICILDADASVRRINPAWRRVVGYAEDELLARPLLDFVHTEDRAAFQEQLAALSATPAPSAVSVEVRFLCQDGQRRWMLWTMAPTGEDGACYAVVRDLTERRETEERFRQLAQRDPLTRLPNRSLFTDRLEQALERALRYEGNIAVLFVDLDSFKAVNDQMGHDAGDAVLVSVAERMERCVRAIDTVARLGGDEFVIILQDIREPQSAAVVAQRILDQLAEPIALECGARRVSASIGVSVFPVDGDNSEDLVRAADSAMYRAKEAGGGDFRFAHVQ
jgi:diguanylate cyclase (GGDEF)-like protein/PAS domain S-box-containing protein